MRKILFRGKDVVNNEWVYGFVAITEMYPYKGEQNSYIWKIPCVDNLVQVIPETVGQFTGRKNKKGQEIWEADIIRLCRKNEDTLTYIVRWSDICSSWICQCIEHKSFITELGELWDFELEVIGNIHDNPELMATPKEASDGK